MALRIRMQDFRVPQKHASVKIISVNQFCLIARKLVNFRRTERELLQHLLVLPIFRGEHVDSQSLVLTLPYGRSTHDCVLFWLER